MKNMTKAKEYYTPPPEGTYPGLVVSAVPSMSKAGSTMIELTVQIDGAGNGEQASDYLLTDGNAKGAGLGRNKLRALGVNVDTDAEIPDEAICQQLTGMRINVTIGHEQQMTKESGYKEPAKAVNEKGETIELKKIRIVGYSRHGAAASTGTGAVATGTQTTQATQPAQPVQQWGGMPQGAPQGFAPQGGGQPGFAPQGQPGFAPQGFAPQGAPTQGFAPQQFAPQGQPGFAPQNGMAPAYPQQGAPQQFAQAPWAPQTK